MCNYFEGRSISFHKSYLTLLCLLCISITIDNFYVSYGQITVTREYARLRYQDCVKESRIEVSIWCGSAGDSITTRS